MNTEDRNAGTAWIVGLIGGAVLTLSYIAAQGVPFGIGRAVAVEPLPTSIDPDAYVTKVLRYQAQADPHQPAGAVVFLGDSLTQGLAVAAVSPGAINLGIAHLTAERLSVVVPRSQAVAHAGTVVLMIGTNDIAQGRDPIPAIRKLARIDAPLVWHAIPPANGVEPVAVNAEIARLCAAHGRCRFVQTAFVPGDFTDGTHLSEAGYAKFIASLRGAMN